MGYATEPQKALMAKLKIGYPSDITFEEASHLIDTKLKENAGNRAQGSNFPTSPYKEPFKAPSMDDKNKIMMLSYAKDLAVELIKQNEIGVTQAMLEGYMTLSAQAIKAGLRELEKK